MQTQPQTPQSSPILAAWREQLSHAANHPFLLQLLFKQYQRLLKRMVYFYAQLASLPRRRRRALQRALATSLVGAAMLLALSSAPVAFANTIAVTTKTLGIADDGFCSLAEAITNANNNSQLYASAGECPAGDPGADTITLSDDVLLPAALPGISSEITLEGNGSYVSGDHTFQVFLVTGTGDFTMNETTVKYGYVNGRGGGIRTNVSSILEVNDSTVTGNIATDHGGGIYSQGKLTINNSTISDNESGNYGGGVCHYDENNALDRSAINNSTISGNSARLGGGIFNGAPLTVSNSTITGNTAETGGGVLPYSGTTLFLHRSLISGNRATLANELYADGPVIADDYNLFGDSGETNAEALYDFTPGASDFNATSDGDGTSHHTAPTGTALASILNPTLANNGGPNQTHALVSGSPAIDKAPNDECTDPPINDVDQRGDPRNVDINGGSPSYLCDIGAYELQVSTAVNVANVRGMARAGNNVLKWETTTESGIAGFNVHRKMGKHAWKQVNARLKQARHAGSAEGANYRFADRHVASGKRYRYKIEVIYLDGHTEFTNVVRVPVK